MRVDDTEQTIKELWPKCKVLINDHSDYPKN